MSSINRFLKFEKTNLYINFGSVLTVEPILVMDNEHEYYYSQMDYLRDTFNCNKSPTRLQMDTYISTNEYIEEELINEFIIFTNKLFDQYITICNILKKNNTKRKLKERINAEKENSRKERDAIKTQLRAFNKELITCICGMQHIRSSTSNHLLSNDHKIRLDAINWYKSNQEKYVNISIDNVSAITDDLSEI